MKTLSEVNQEILKSLCSGKNEICHVVGTNEGYKPFQNPIFAKDHTCEFCGSQDYFTWLVDAETRAWMCGRICSSSKLPNSLKGMDTPTIGKRSILWAEFCEISGIGDLFYDVRFEKIDQDQKKLDYFLKFALNPKGIIYMQGEPSSGKTYACMGICEFFTRKSVSCIFITYKKMIRKWMEDDLNNKNIDKFNSVCLLVVDDFGTGEPSKAFLEFFMELINFRMQWTNRGTIITTNLKAKEFTQFCGDALFERINTGQSMIFKDNNRRKPQKI